MHTAEHMHASQQRHPVREPPLGVQTLVLAWPLCAGLGTRCWTAEDQATSCNNSCSTNGTDPLTCCCACSQEALVVLQSLLHLLLSHLPDEATCMPTACKQVLQTMVVRQEVTGRPCLHIWHINDAVERRVAYWSALLLCVHCIMKPHMLCRSMANSQGCGS